METTTTAQDIIQYMESLHDEEQRRVLMGFFKTGKGEYGEGDEFLGIKVPQTREVVKAAKDTPLSEIPTLLKSHWHEVRLCGWLLLVDRFERLATKRLTNNPDAIRQRDEIVMLYLKHAEQANNWDLVDMSAPKVIGHWLLLPTCIGGKTAGLHHAAGRPVVVSPLCRDASASSPRPHAQGSRLDAPRDGQTHQHGPPPRLPRTACP